MRSGSGDDCFDIAGLLILPAMVLLRRLSWLDRALVCVKSIAIGAAAYLLTNPYVPYDYLFHRSAIESNMRNFQSVYHPSLSLDGIGNAMYLTAAGASPIVAFIGAIGILALGWRAIQVRRSVEPAELRRRATGLLLAIPALVVSGQFVAFAAGKPGEFARFMLLADLFLLVEAVVVVATFIRNVPVRRIGGASIVVSAAIPAFFYLRGFIRDSRPETSRILAAEDLQSRHVSGRPKLAVFSEPAPYCLPPVNLFDMDMILFPANAPCTDLGQYTSIMVTDRSGGILPAEQHWTSTPISWADKRMVESDDSD